MENTPSARAVRLEITALPSVNFALQQNGIQPIRAITILNDGDALENVTLQITSGAGLCLPFFKHFAAIPAGACLQADVAGLTLDAQKLAIMTESYEDLLTISLTQGETALWSDTLPITVLAYDQWHGYGTHPELLAAFVTPNHPAIAQLVGRSAQLLEAWTSDPSLDGYQTQDPNRALQQAAAIYAAIQEQNIVYCVPPASFEQSGQRVRLCDAILQQKLATCLDLSLLYAACLEAVGLHPLLVLQPGHIFCGVWLEELTFPETLLDDVTALTKRLASGINEIAVVECTAMNAGKNMTFDQAQAAAREKLAGTDPIEFVLDISRARLTGLKPMPVRIATEHGWEFPRPLLPQKELSQAPQALTDTTQTAQGQSPLPEKMVLWERKLLDLGMRNNLINMRLRGSTVPLLASSLDELENALSSGKDFSVLPCPEDLSFSPKGDFEAFHQLQGSSQLLSSEFAARRLRSGYDEDRLSKAMKELYRSGKSSLEENGANTLYLALGLLRWYETDRSSKARYAPLVLLPIEMVRKSAAAGYVIRLREEEGQMNITLLEKLKQDFGLVINGLDPLPEDQDGIDIRQVFNTIRKAIMQQPRWDVLESAYLGIFSFSQFVMWNDLRNRSQDLMVSKIVRSLIDGKLSWDAQPMDIPDQVSDQGVYLPMAADASQLFAIGKAAQGESFVLHGPPGTGKSQTITTLIANALANGQSVLFVAEKMAALEVVQKRLTKIGIGDFCLELHSNKAKKRWVLDQLRRATEVRGNVSSQEYAARAQQLHALRQELDSYAQALHAPNAWGMSLHQMVGLYQENTAAPDLPAFPETFVTGLTEQELHRHRLLCEQLVSAGKAITHPHGHPLAQVGCAQYSQQLRYELSPALDGYRAAIYDLQEPAAALSSLTGLPASSGDHLASLSQSAGALSQWLSLPRAWAASQSPQVLIADAAQMARHFLSAQQLQQELLSRWKPDFLTLDGAQLLAQWEQTQAKWFLGKALGENKLLRQVNVYALKKATKEALPSELKLLRSYRQELEAGNALLARCRGDLGDLYTGEQTNYPAVLTAAQKAGALLSRLPEAVRQPIAGDSAHANAISAYLTAWEGFCQARQKLTLLLSLTSSQEQPEYLAQELALCARLDLHRDSLKDYIAFNSVAAQLCEAGLGSLVQAYKEGLPHEDVLSAYYKAISRAMTVYTIDHSPALSVFSGAVFNEKIRQLSRLEEELMKLSQEEIFCRLAARVPDFTKEAAHSSELGILQRAIRSGGRGISIRKLLTQLPNLLPRLCPCMLMSPISAAQYLEPDRQAFDTVVFDEASQLPTAKAVGALARGKNAVIVGDPKQMPPTSFFISNQLDEDNLEQEDLESILDDCLALNLPQTHLLWHYRSRHESLIAFSNARFYENKLYTFPSVNDRISKVSLQHVDGLFQRSKTRQNRAEAEAVVEELKRRCHDENACRQSVGVVTFNIHQQHLIDDLLGEACRCDPQLDAWAYQSEEPIFIKNLENVQGDERDVILFSVGYGPDESGKVYMNFGPLNRDGGWRRLNVAITRARQEMKVFATLRPEQIDLTRTSAQGVQALKAFLEYAQDGRLPLEENAVSSRSLEHSGIADAICAWLRENGYETQRHVGHSEYRIDIGVADPQKPDTYCLGILLDGSSYGAQRTTRDRETAQIGVLQGLGWRITRVWTMDWWDNPQREKDRLLALLKNPAPAPSDPAPSLPELPQQLCRKDAPQEDIHLYRFARLPQAQVSPEELLNSRYTPGIRKRILMLLDREAPISKASLQKRIVQSYGITRSGSRISGHLDALLGAMELKTTQSAGQVFYWRQDQDPETYSLWRTAPDEDSRREPGQIPVEEAAAALCQALADQLSLNREDLVREGAKLLGYPRTGSAIAQLMEDAILYARHKGRIGLSSNGNFALTP